MCEVMLRDMTDSKWVDGHVQSRQAVHMCFKLIIPFF